MTGPARTDDTFRVLLTGSRVTTTAQDAYVQAKLAELRRQDEWLHGPRIMVVVQGVCEDGGVDLAGQRWALATPGVENEGHPADWRKGKGAGPARNTKMVGLGADIVLAFPGKFSRGTWDCLQKAVAAGIPPRLYPLHIFCPAEEATA